MLKTGVNALEFMGTRGLSQAVKSDFAKKKIKNVSNKYLDQAFDSFTSDLFRKIDPVKGGAIDIQKLSSKLGEFHMRMSPGLN